MCTGTFSGAFSPRLLLPLQTLLASRSGSACASATVVVTYTRRTLIHSCRALPAHYLISRYCATISNHLHLPWHPDISFSVPACICRAGDSPLSGRRFSSVLRQFSGYRHPEPSSLHRDFPRGSSMMFTEVGASGFALLPCLSFVFTTT